MSFSLRTVSCILCSSTQSQEMYRNHLIEDHGVVFDVEFLFKTSIHKQIHSDLPILVNPNEGAILKPALVHSSCQTLTDEPECEDNLCHKCQVNGMLDVWPCPTCPLIYRRRRFHDQHMTAVHHWTSEQVVNIKYSIKMTEEEFNDRQRKATAFSINSGSNNYKKVNKQELVMADNVSSKVSEEKWGPNPCSTQYTCLFCLEAFKRDTNLSVHLSLVHSEEPVDLMEKARRELTESKLDGCLHQCKLCGGQYAVAASFARHIRDMHQLTTSRYKEQYGDSEVVTNIFTCKLCNKKLKHTRNILSQHMKLVHQLSWQQYLDRIQKSRDSPSMPETVLFDCKLCQSKVKMKSQHLIKQHNMEEDVYDKMESADNTKDIPDCVVTCGVCSRLCLNLQRHIKMAHKLTREEYDRVIFLKHETEEDSKPETAALRLSDLRCYFQCGEVFKKDYQLKLHLKIKHGKEDSEELRKAEEAATEEISLTRISGCKIQCALCSNVLSSRASLWSHVTRMHGISFQQYKVDNGGNEMGAAQFQCKICQKSVKYERSSVVGHLKGIHGVTWEQYVAMVRGETVDMVAPVEMIECRLCGASVKHINLHVKNTHNISMEEFKELVESSGALKVLDGVARCEICNSDVKTLKKHLKKTHHISLAEYSEIITTGISNPEDESVICSICKSAVKNLQPHLKKYHNIAMDQYEVLKDDESLSYAGIPLKQEVFEPASNNDSKNQISEPLRNPPKSEIQDRGNTNCSACQVDCGNRRKFVAHCQVVHQIKFKTKSGVALPAASSSKFGNIYSGAESSATMNVIKRLGSEPSSMSEFSTKGVKRSRSGRMVRGEGNVKCENCNKMFSTVGNKEKHKRLACNS